jgi:hypothetical protein
MSVLAESKGEAEERHHREGLKQIKNGALVAAECSQTKRGANGSEKRETTWRSDSGHQSANRTNAIENGDSTFHGDSMHELRNSAINWINIFISASYRRLYCLGVAASI